MIPYKSNHSSNRRLHPKERHSKNRWDILVGRQTSRCLLLLCKYLPVQGCCLSRPAGASPSSTETGHDPVPVVCEMGATFNHGRQVARCMEIQSVVRAWTWRSSLVLWSEHGPEAALETRASLRGIFAGLRRHRLSWETSPGSAFPSLSITILTSWEFGSVLNPGQPGDFKAARLCCHSRWSIPTIERAVYLTPLVHFKQQQNRH